MLSSGIVSDEVALRLQGFAKGVGTLLRSLRSTSMRQKLRNDMEEGLPGWENLYRCCGWDKIIISSVLHKKNQYCVGKSVHELADWLHQDPFEFVFDLLYEESLQVGMIDFYGDETTLESILLSDYQTVCTDGIFAKTGTHPRLYGAFPRVLNRYVLQENLLSLPQAIQKMTSYPASLLHLPKRGKLEVGCHADIVVFDPAEIKDRATYHQPQQFPQGIEWVLVNGSVTIDNQSRLQQRAGKLLA